MCLGKASLGAGLSRLAPTATELRTVDCTCQDMERAEDEIHRLQTEESQGFPAARDEEDLKKRKAATGGLLRMCPVSTCESWRPS